MKIEMLAWVLFVLSAVNASGGELKKRTWTVGSDVREALIHMPSFVKKNPAPVIFFFHGRNGKMADSAQHHRFYDAWPEAIVVYPQGLPTPALKGNGKNLLPGWQVAPDQFENRDLKFFDQIVATLKREYPIDEKRMYVTGTSNGGGMVFLLWAERGEQFAAVAPTCTAAKALATIKSEDAVRKLPPLPCLHIAGDKDTTIPLESQRETTRWICEGRKCGPGQAWEDYPPTRATLHPSSHGGPVIEYTYSGGHGLPYDLAPLIVRFFKAYSR